MEHAVSVCLSHQNQTRVWINNCSCEPIAADCILSLSLHTLLWMDVISYDHSRLKYAKLVTMTSQESSITSQNSHRIVTLHHSHISLICVLSLSPPVLRSIRAYPLLHPRLIQFLPPPPLSAAAAAILSSRSLFTGSLNIATAWPGLMIRITPSHCPGHTRPLPGHRSLESQH